MIYLGLKPTNLVVLFGLAQTKNTKMFFYLLALSAQQIANKG